MIKLGVNSILFAGYDFATASRHIALAGYDGIEISAIKGMCEHLELDRWKEQVSELKQIAADNRLEFLATEVAALDENRLMKAYEAATEIGIPVINVGPGGRSDVEEDYKRTLEILEKMSEKAEEFDITLCVKAHVGGSIYNTPTTLRAMGKIVSKGFGIDMDPSHIFRSGEKPEEALPQVLNKVRHIHIRDCIEKTGGPGTPQNQTCGRGNINLFGYCKAMVDGGYSGPVDLEVIGAREFSLSEVCIIAAETYGYLNACLKILGAR